MGLHSGVHISTDVKNLANKLKEEYKLSDFEALSLAFEAERNELLKIGFVISNSDSYPSGLEAIALGLGYKR